MRKRALSVTEQANSVLTFVDAVGSQPGARRSRFISELAKDVFEAVFQHIPAGTLDHDPVYAGLDPHFAGYSRYTFRHGRIEGLYASSPDEVILLNLHIAATGFQELAAERVA
jgi:hypothetical protein